MQAVLCGFGVVRVGRGDVSTLKRLEKTLGELQTKDDWESLRQALFDRFHFRGHLSFLKFQSR